MQFHPASQRKAKTFLDPAFFQHFYGLRFCLVRDDKAGEICVHMSRFRIDEFASLLPGKFLAPAVICKNLFLCNTQKTKFYLLMIRGDKKFKTKEISSQIHSARLSFAPAEKMEEYLDILLGSVSVLGLMNDKEHQVQLLVDEDVLNAEYVGCHPCVNTSSLRLKTSDIFNTFLKEVSHDYITVVLSE